MNRLQLYAFTAAVAFLVAISVTPLVEKLAKQVGAIDKPDGVRKIHRREIPRMGGLAIAIAALVAWLGAAGFLHFSKLDYLVNFHDSFAIFLGAGIVAIVGMADDMLSLSPFEKFVGQLVGASVLLMMGLGIDFIAMPFTHNVLVLGFWSYPVTLFWMVAMLNVMNFIDGLDGLAAGVAAIAGFSFFLSLSQRGQVGMALIAIALVGACIGFLRHNFYPATIFMGDTGSMFIGYLLGAIAVQGVMKSFAATSLLIPVVVLGVPVIDTALAILRRSVKNAPITIADRGHIHHQLLGRGISHRGAVLFIYGWSALLALSGYFLGRLGLVPKLLIYLGLGVVSWFLMEYTGMLNELREALRERAANGRNQKKA